ACAHAPAPAVGSQRAGAQPGAGCSRLTSRPGPALRSWSPARRGAAEAGAPVGARVRSERVSPASSGLFLPEEPASQGEPLPPLLEQPEKTGVAPGVSREEPAAMLPRIRTTGPGMLPKRKRGQLSGSPARAVLPAPRGLAVFCSLPARRGPCAPPAPKTSALDQLMPAGLEQACQSGIAPAHCLPLRGLPASAFRPFSEPCSGP
ncbi:PREDICTED: phosphatidylinositol 4,5-bisphosphate 5-phosphatase A-like, partial [Chinchilla lanigera]|uniref:phosphatidylinositol 4,5-bisphosphate 5-phosphatase A-like n=1 Tax=Chinchilla lanigera TaxID=34839 RepID=UPI000698324F